MLAAVKVCNWCDLLSAKSISSGTVENAKYLPFAYLESGEQLLVNTSDANFRATFTKNSIENLQKIKNDITKIKVEMVNVSEQIPFDKALRQFFDQRMRR